VWAGSSWRPPAAQPTEAHEGRSDWGCPPHLDSTTTAAWAQSAEGGDAHVNAPCLLSAQREQVLLTLAESRVQAVGSFGCWSTSQSINAGRNAIQYAPLPWFSESSVPANDCPAPSNTHTHTTRQHTTRQHTCQAADAVPVATQHRQQQAVEAGTDNFRAKQPRGVHIEQVKLQDSLMPAVAVQHTAEHVYTPEDV
jgi:hypothetical protein